MNIQTERLIITEFTMDMAEAVHKNSLDEDNRRFVPDEVFETPEEARETLEFLISRYGGSEGPYVYPVLLRDGTNVGYVQLAPMEEGWEIGYHIAKDYTGRGIAAEVVGAFLPNIMKTVGIRRVEGVCLKDNRASCRVMEKCGFQKLFEGMGQYQGKERNICRYRFELG